MLIFDLFAGTKSSTKAFADAGHVVISFEMNPKFQTTEIVNVFDLSAKDLIQRYGRPDFVWASPPCTAFSVASIGKHWALIDGVHQPKTDDAVLSQELVKHTISLINDLNPRFGWLIENPRGILRKLPFMQDLPRRTITYCQYGDFRMKPTDLWGSVEGWTAKEPCKNGDTCHESAPRGSSKGTQSIKEVHLKSMIPYSLGEEILFSITTNNKV